MKVDFRRLSHGLMFGVVVLVCSVQRVSAQGTFLFSNLADGVDAPIYELTIYPNGSQTSPLSGPDWVASVYLASDLGMGNPLETQIFSDVPESAGYFFGPVVEVSGASPGEVVPIVVGAYSSDNIYSVGYSNPFDVTLGGGNLPPGSLENLQSFEVWVFVDVPEPSTWILLTAGAVVALLKLGPVSGRKKAEAKL